MPPADKFRIALMQTSCAIDPNENLAKTEWKIREAAAGGAQIVCLQELFRSQYFCREENHELFALAEPIPGPSTEALGKLARELEVVIVASLFERRAAGLYHNTAAVLGTDGEIAGIYRKMHIPDDPLYFEKFYFTPGDLGFQQFRHAVRPHRRAGLLGPVVSGRRAPRRRSAARTFCFIPPPSAGIPAKKRSTARRSSTPGSTIQRSHAIANGIYVAAVNRVGYEGPPGHGHRILGIVVRGRSVRAGDRAGFRRPGRNSDRRVRSRAAWKKCAATGPSCATAASTPTLRF